MNTEDPIHDIILDPDQRKGFIKALQMNLDSLRNQELEAENKKIQLNSKINETISALHRLESIDRFIDNNGMSAVKIFCETHSEEMNQAQKDRISEEEPIVETINFNVS